MTKNSKNQHETSNSPFSLKGKSNLPFFHDIRFKPCDIYERREEKKMFDHAYLCNIALYCILGSAIWFTLYTTEPKKKAKKNKK